MTDNAPGPCPFCWANSTTWKGTQPLCQCCGAMGPRRGFAPAGVWTILYAGDDKRATQLAEAEKDAAEKGEIER